MPSLLGKHNRILGGAEGASSALKYSLLRKDNGILGGAEEASSAFTPRKT